VALAISMRLSLVKAAHAAASRVTKQESGFTPFQQEMKEFFFYGDSRHTDASGHDHQAQ
jgi:hypothetical protein